MNNILQKTSKTINWINTHLPVLCVSLSIIAMLIAGVIYKVSIFHPLKRIAVEQAEYDEKLAKLKNQKEMVKRHLKLGKSFLDNSRYKAAKREFNNVLNLDKMNPEAQMGIFKTEVYEYMRGEDYIPEVVERQIEFILEEDREDPHALVLMGDLYASLDNMAMAEGYYKKALKSATETASAYFGLGIIYQKQNKTEDALKMYKQAVRLSKWNEHYLDNLAYLYLKKGDYRNAIENYQLILTLDYEFLLTYCEIAIAYWLMGDLDMAVRYQDRLVSLINDDNIAKLDKNNGVWFFEAGREAVSLYSIEEKRYYALLSLSVTHFLSGRQEEADKYAQEAKAIEIATKADIKHLVLFDLHRFKDKHPAYSNQIERYREL
ncbi:MAG: tetratricopeptide repeat protein [bacterium]